MEIILGNLYSIWMEKFLRENIAKCTKKFFANLIDLNLFFIQKIHPKNFISFQYSYSEILKSIDFIKQN